MSSEVVNHEGKISEEEMEMETETGEKIENHHTEMQIMFCHPIVGNDSVLDQMQYMAPHMMELQATPIVCRSCTTGAVWANRGEILDLSSAVCFSQSPWCLTSRLLSRRVRRSSC